MPFRDTSRSSSNSPAWSARTVSKLGLNRTCLLLFGRLPDRKRVLVLFFEKTHAPTLFCRGSYERPKIVAPLERRLFCCPPFSATEKLPSAKGVAPKRSPIFNLRVRRARLPAVDEHLRHGDGGVHARQVRREIRGVRKSGAGAVRAGAVVSVTQSLQSDVEQ